MDCWMGDRRRGWQSGSSRGLGPRKMTQNRTRSRSSATRWPRAAHALIALSLAAAIAAAAQRFGVDVQTRDELRDFTHELASALALAIVVGLPRALAGWLQHGSARDLDASPTRALADVARRCARCDRNFLRRRGRGRWRWRVSHMAPHAACPGASVPCRTQQRKGRAR